MSNSLRIGVDARLLGEEVTGIGRYSYELLSRLVSFGGHKWFLYTPRIVLSKPRVAQGCVQAYNRSPSLSGGRVWRMLWSQTIMPWQANHDRLDVFWGTTHRLPRLLSSRVARVVTIHDLVWRHAGETMRPFSRFVESVLMPQAVALADVVLADSMSTAEGLHHEFPHYAPKVRHVSLGSTPLPVPENTEVVVRRLGLERPFFLFTGTLEPRKNLPRLLEAVALLPATLRQGLLLAIAGGRGWGGVDVASLTRRLGIQDQVRVLGYVSDEELAALYSQALFLAMPSLYEGFGLPLLEAMHFGTPVLASNCSSLPEVVGDAGIMVNPLSSESIRDGLMALLQDNVVRKELASRAKANAARFTWERTAQETLAAFEDAVALRQQLHIRC